MPLLPMNSIPSYQSWWSGKTKSKETTFDIKIVILENRNNWSLSMYKDLCHTCVLHWNISGTGIGSMSSNMQWAPYGANNSILVPTIRYWAENESNWELRCQNEPRLIRNILGKQKKVFTSAIKYKIWAETNCHHRSLDSACPEIGGILLWGRCFKE